MAAARKTLPEPPSPDLAVKSHALSSDGKQMSLTLTVPEGTAPDEVEIFVTGPSGHVFFGDGERRLDGNALTVALPISGLPRKYDIHGKHWGLLVKIGGGPWKPRLPLTSVNLYFAANGGPNPARPKPARRIP